MQTRLLLGLSILTGLLLIGCGAGDGTGLDDQGQPIGNQPDPGDPEPPALQANLSSIQELVLTPICTQCHAGNAAPLGLRMDDLQTSIANLINVDSVTNPKFKRIYPGQSAEQSFLFLKIIGDPQAGNRMPLGQPPLSTETIAVFRTWIESGAPINPPQLLVTKARIERDQQKATASINLSFNQPIDADSVSSADIQLLAANKVTQWHLDSSPLPLTWTQTNQFELSAIPIEADVIQLSIRLNQAHLSSVFSQSGMWLDGNQDGFPGGEYSYEHQF